MGPVSQPENARIGSAVVYVGVTGDFVHHGHINILRRAADLGPVTVGLLTDKAAAHRKKIPAMTYEQRKVIFDSLRWVSAVVPQDEWSYENNILKFRPRFFVHGDDWRVGAEFLTRQKAIRALESYGGELVEFPYTEGISSGALRSDVHTVASTPEVRRSMLRRSLGAKPLSRFLEVHSPLAGIVAENATATVEGAEENFDGFWSSSLTDSTVLGRPDTELVTIATRLERINQMFEVTTLPMIFDADTGGRSEHFSTHIQSMERLGISAAIIEDKEGLKRNSLLGNSVFQQQAEVQDFCDKIESAQSAKKTTDFMVIARVESLILEKGMDEALMRAKAYVDAGADGVMIHSRSSSADEVIRFAERFRKWNDSTPLVCVPTTYNSVREQVLSDAGFNVVIYANHLLRSAYPAMMKTAISILENRRSAEIDGSLTPISEILSLIPGTA